MKLYRFFAYAFSATLFVSSLLIVIYRQEVIDWWRLRDYEPSAAIVTLADNASFSEEGRKLFYVHDPELLNKKEFQGKCSQDEETIVLGCYITHDKIYVFDVEEERLEGVEEVTAAHEMLHAVYDRLSQSDKDRLNPLLQQVYDASDDERLQKTIENYRKRDASVVLNELHSILATEVRELPDELEQHYRQYFVDRVSVVAIAEAYASEFTKLEDRIKEYDQRLERLDALIEEQEVNIEQLNAALDTERIQLEAERGDPEAYNAGVPGYNALVRDFNTEVQELRQLIEQFNTLVAERNAIAVEEKELADALDTRLEEL